MRSKNILIISDRGFIGKSLYNNFKTINEYKVYGLNSNTCNLLDFNKTYSVLSKLISQPFTIIFLSTFGRFPKDDYSVYRKNTEMITNFLKSIKPEFIEQFIFFSSTCLYGRPPKKNLISENLECLPNGYYGLSKFVSEKLIQLHLSNPITIIRVPGVYGELDRNKSIINLFIDKITKNEEIIIYDNGIVLRDFVYINDIIEVIKHAINLKSSLTLNIATGKSKTIIEILKHIEKTINTKAKVKFLESNHIQFDMKFDISKLKNFIPNFKPTIMEEGIRQNIEKKYSNTSLSNNY